MQFTVVRKHMNNTAIRFLLFLTALYGQLNALAGSVDTIITYSPSMQKEIKAVIILPESYVDTTKHFPVVYLLHGFSGAYDHWLRIAPHLKKQVDDYQMIIVCPDGGYNSWYIDSPINPSVRYETYTASELISQIDSKYRTINNRSQRAITGLSMGGHGGLFLGMRHKETFGAAGSMSGGVDLRQYTASWNLKEKILGDTVCCKQNWETHSVINVMDQIANNELQLIIDCGIEDFFIGVNRALHQKLLVRKINHDYIERPGAHNAEYWRNSVDYQLLYFHKYFETQKKS